MKSLAIFIAKNALALVIGMLISSTNLSPFENWQWWAWLLSILACVVLRDLAIHLESKK